MKTKIAMFLVVLGCVAMGGGQQQQQSGVAPGKIQMSEPSALGDSRFLSTIGDPIAICKAPCTDYASISVSSATGHIDRLRDSEYAGLEKLRKAVEFEEFRIAKAHGVYTNPCDGVSLSGPQTMPNFGCNISPGLPLSDSYEFRGQWLLINVPAKEKP